MRQTVLGLHSQNAPDTRWAPKEHMPWIASMLTTAVAFIAVRRPSATFPPLWALVS